MQTTSKNLNKELTEAEFIQLYTDAVELYKKAVWNLADVISLGKKKLGRSIIEKLTSFDLSKLQWFVGISEVNKRHNDLLPEHHQEVIGNERASYWLKIAVEKSLKPLSLRKEIRNCRSMFSKVKKIDNVAVYPKYCDLIKLELSRMSNEQRQKAREYIASTI